MYTPELIIFVVVGICRLCVSLETNMLFLDVDLESTVQQTVTCKEEKVVAHIASMGHADDQIFCTPSTNLYDRHTGYVALKDKIGNCLILAAGTEFFHMDGREIQVFDATVTLTQMSNQLLLFTAGWRIASFCKDQPSYTLTLTPAVESLARNGKAVSGIRWCIFCVVRESAQLAVAVTSLKTPSFETIDVSTPAEIDFNERPYIGDLVG